MSSILSPEKRIPVLDRSVIDSLDEYHRALSTVLTRKGLLKIIDDSPTPGGKL
ncbi:MAG: hypothetical protein WCX22_01925 [Methanoregula sp.]